MRKYTFALYATATIFSLSACASQTGAPVGYQYLNEQTLWYELSHTNDTATILQVEAELASRGSIRSSAGNEYIGRRTSSGVGKSIYSRSETVTGNYNCSDFPSAAEAQKFFLAAGGPTKDPHGLDKDGDGNACEWGNALKSSVRQHHQYKASQVATTKKVQTTTRAKSSTRVRSSSRCYTGPRGGTYTITASGNRNYSGC